MYDVIVVGARVAGAPTAMLLARKGYRVLLVDKDPFPSDIMSTHYIHQPGVAKLERWGLRERLAASVCPAVTTMSLDFGPFVLRGSPPPAGDVREAYAPRRYVLDPLLATAAVAAGVEFRDRFAVQELVHDGAQVVGIRGHGRGGDTVTEQARLIIGADGHHSLVARSVAAAVYNQQPTTNCAYYTYWSGVPVAEFEVYVRERRAFGAFPTNDGLTCIVVGWPHAEFAAYRADIEGNYLQTLALAPELAERVWGGTREERWVGTADLPNFFRKPYGPGWALVGDAGYVKDPTTAQGISDAFRDAEVLADAVDSGIAGRQPLAEALAGYERQRNEAVAAVYEFTCQLASYQPPPPDMQHLLGALAGNPEQASRFLGLIAGTTAFGEFFAPQNLQRLLGPAVHRAAIQCGATARCCGCRRED